MSEAPSKVSWAIRQTLTISGATSAHCLPSRKKRLGSGWTRLPSPRRVSCRRLTNSSAKLGIARTTRGGWKMSRARKRVSDGTEKKLRNLKPFKPGQSGNPKGRPKGARNRLGTQFLEALAADFNTFGPETIALVREKKPEVYIRVVADLLPKEANINVEAGEAFVELWRRISDGLGDDLANRMDAEQEPAPSVRH